MCRKENPWKYFRSRRISIHSCLRTQIGCLLTQISAQISRAFYSSKIVHPFMVLSIKVDVAGYTRLLNLLNFSGPLISVISPPFPCFPWLSPISAPFSVSEPRGHGPQMSQRTSRRKKGGEGGGGGQEPRCQRRPPCNKIQGPCLGGRNSVETPKVCDCLFKALKSFISEISPLLCLFSSQEVADAKRPFLPKPKHTPHVRQTPPKHHKHHHRNRNHQYIHQQHYQNM